MQKANIAESFDNSFDKSALATKEKNSENAGNNSVSAWKEMEKDFSQKKALLGDKSQNSNSNDNELYFSDPFKSNKDDKATYLKKNDWAKNGGTGGKVEGELEFSPGKQKSSGDDLKKDFSAADSGLKGGKPEHHGGKADENGGTFDNSKPAVPADGGMKDKVVSQDGGAKDKVVSQDGGAKDKVVSQDGGLKGSAKGKLEDYMFIKPAPEKNYYEQLL